MNRNEVERHPSVCHSHDFCDANMAMDAAADRLHIDLDAPKNDGLWTQAWDIAKQNRFYTTSTTLQDDLIAFVKKFYVDYEGVRDVNEETDAMVERARKLLVRAGVPESEYDPEAHAIEQERQGNEISERAERDAEERG